VGSDQEGSVASNSVVLACGAALDYLFIVKSAHAGDEQVCAEIEAVNKESKGGGTWTQKTDMPTAQFGRNLG